MVVNVCSITIMISIINSIIIIIINVIMAAGQVNPNWQVMHRETGSAAILHNLLARKLASFGSKILGALPVC